ncbi:exported hypothetical protein [Candidatus Sulfopaludibacter sp. SbA3]|nr:exported hypothetical protein [Candidatus Sulfopaludibacter sp. SbA3]
MFAPFLRGAGAAVFFASLVCAQGSPDGHWEGVITVNNRDVGLSLDLARNEKSQWTASMGVPAQNVTGLFVKDLAVSGKSVKFLAVELQMSTVDLTLGPDGKLTGTVSNQRGSVPVAFQRAGDAKVELPPTSPAVSKELEGDWEGTLQAGSAAFQMVVHFRNQADKTVSATIDISTTGAMGMPIAGVKQTGQKVEFDLKIARGSFRGTLNAEGTEISGQFTHEADTVPLILRKK